MIHAGDAGKGARELPEKSDPFHDQFVALFDTLFHRIYRVLDRISGDPDLAADLAQEAFIKLYQRGFLPDSPEAWLISVAMNLFRNARTTGKRRQQLLSLAFPASKDLAPAPQEGGNHSQRVRRALDQLSERDRQILLLQADGFSYREIAAGLGLHEASIGVFLARARQAFRKLYGDADHASG